MGLYFMGLTNKQKKKMGFEIDEGKTIDWENEEEACAQMKQLVPELEDWVTAVIWRILDEAKSDPEGMDIDKLHASALSILTDVTNNHMVAAGGVGQVEVTLVIDKMMNMVTEARNESRLVIENEKN